jgi:hypothetical protein
MNKEAKKLFSQCLLIEKALINLQGSGNEYYKVREDLTRALKDLIYKHDFSGFNGYQLLKLNSLVSTFRPVEPWQYLLRCGILLGNVNNKPVRP